MIQVLLMFAMAGPLTWFTADPKHPNVITYGRNTGKTSDVCGIVLDLGGEWAANAIVQTRVKVPAQDPKTKKTISKLEDRTDYQPKMNIKTKAEAQEFVVKTCKLQD